MVKDWMLSPKSKKRQECLPSIQHNSGSPSQGIQAQEEKATQTEKKGVTVSPSVPSHHVI